MATPLLNRPLPPHDSRKESRKKTSKHPKKLHFLNVQIYRKQRPSIGSASPTLTYFNNSTDGFFPDSNQRETKETRGSFRKHSSQSSCSSSSFVNDGRRRSFNHFGAFDFKFPALPCQGLFIYHRLSSVSRFAILASLSPSNFISNEYLIISILLKMNIQI